MQYPYTALICANIHMFKIFKKMPTTSISDTYVSDADEHVLGEEPAQHGPRLIADADQLAGGPLRLALRHLPTDAPRHAAVHTTAQTCVTQQLAILYTAGWFIYFFI